MENQDGGKVFVGPAGWSYEDWKGIVYPPGMPRSSHALDILAPLFNTVEINATFYHPTKPAYCTSWLGKVSGYPDFRFTAKLWQRFTHEREAWPSDAEIQRFKDGIAPLAEAGRLGGLLVQFPWSFKRTPENRQWLAKVASAFADYPLVLEIRHASWDRPEVYDGLSERGIAFCNIDQPLFDDSIAPSEKTTAKVGYIRFHGRNRAAWFDNKAGRNERYNYLYSEDELRPWIEKIRNMRRKVNSLFVITNNHYCGQAVVNAIEIQAALGYATYRLPGHLVEHYPRLRRLLAQEPDQRHEGGA